jgi:hypothetical protein
MSRIDTFIQRIPGSLPLKSFIAACLVCSVAAYPVFIKSPEQSRQGHDYMSSDKPEVIRATQEQLRKEYRHQRNAKLAEEKKEQE